MGNGSSTAKIQVLERTSQILELFTLERTELRFSDIVAECGLTKSTVFNIIDTLRKLDFLEQDDENKKYRLGPKFLRYGEVAYQSIQIVKIAQPIMIQIRDTVNETVQLAKLEGCNTVYLHKVESFHSVQTYSMVGASISAHATGLGKSMLAFKDESYIDRYFSPTLTAFTQHTIKDRDALKEALITVRQERIAYDREEYSLGLVCYACPIFDQKGNVVYAISISAPIYRINQEKEQHIITQLKEKSEILSQKLGYSAKL